MRHLHLEHLRSATHRSLSAGGARRVVHRAPCRARRVACNVGGEACGCACGAASGQCRWVRALPSSEGGKSFSPWAVTLWSSSFFFRAT